MSCAHVMDKMGNGEWTAAGMGEADGDLFQVWTLEARTDYCSRPRFTEHDYGQRPSWPTVTHQSSNQRESVRFAMGRRGVMDH